MIDLEAIRRELSGKWRRGELTSAEYERQTLAATRQWKREQRSLVAANRKRQRESVAAIRQWVRQWKRDQRWRKQAIRFLERLRKRKA